MPTNDQRKTNKERRSTPDFACDDEISLLAGCRVVSKYRWMIVLPAAIAVTAAGLINISRPRMYMATTTVVPPIDVLQKQADLAGGLGGARAMLKGVLSTGGITDLYVGVLKSRAVADAIVDRFDLFHVYERVKTRAEVQGELSKNSRIEVSRRDGIVQIAVKDRDPNRAAAMANAYVEELDLQNKRLSGSQARNRRIFWENRLAQIKAELSQIDTLPAREAQIKEMLFELLAREHELAKMEEAKSMPTIQVLDRAAASERPEPRGTVKKVTLAGVVMLILSTLLAFGREYVTALRAAQPPVRAPGPA